MGAWGPEMPSHGRTKNLCIPDPDEVKLASKILLASGPLVTLLLLLIIGPLVWGGVWSPLTWTFFLIASCMHICTNTQIPMQIQILEQRDVDHFSRKPKIKYKYFNTNQWRVPQCFHCFNWSYVIPSLVIFYNVQKLNLSCRLNPWRYLALVTTT